MLPAQSKRAGGGGCFEARIVERAGAGYGERELAGNFKIAAADPADLRDVDSKLVGVESEFLGVEVVAAGGGKISACFGDMGRRHLEDVMGQRSFNPEACNGFAVDNAAVHRDGARAFQIAERAACVDLRIECASNRQALGAGNKKRLEVGDVEIAGVDARVENGVPVIGWLRTGAGVTRGRRCEPEARRGVECSTERKPGIAVKQQSVLNRNLSGRIATFDVC